MPEEGYMGMTVLRRARLRSVPTREISYILIADRLLYINISLCCSASSPVMVARYAIQAAVVSHKQNLLAPELLWKGTRSK